MTRKNRSFATLNSISPPSTLLLSAIDESNTIITTAKRSSTISTAKTKEANFCWRSPISVKALIMIVVDDMDSIPPRKRLLMLLKLRIRPIENPAHIIPLTIIKAVTTAEPPELSNLRKLNSRPRENSRTTMPISAQKSIFASVVTDGR